MHRQNPRSPDFAKRWGEIRCELSAFGFEFPEYDSQGMFYIPNENFSLKESIEFPIGIFDPWKRIAELVPIPKTPKKSLWNILLGGRAFESNDKNKRLGGIATKPDSSEEHFQPGMSVLYTRERTFQIPTQWAEANQYDLNFDGKTKWVRGKL